MPALPLPFPNGDYEALGDRAGCPRPKDARPVVGETKALMIAVMGEFNRPMTSAELVKAGVAEVVYGPELHFCLTAASGESKSHSGAVSAYGVQAH
jgi:hypothetical protein